MRTPGPPTRRALRFLQWLVLVGVLVISWPTSLGGPVSYVQVSGKSMYPTYSSGDLVVTRERSSYKVGENVVYRVPKGDVAAGAQVVHRIVDGNGRDGFILQGDNNAYRDLWHPRHGDIVGRVELHIPNAGAWVAHIARPINLGILCGSLTIMSLLWPRRGGSDDRRNSGDRRVADRRATALRKDDDPDARAGEDRAAEAPVTIQASASERELIPWSNDDAKALHSVASRNGGSSGDA